MVVESHPVAEPPVDTVEQFAADLRELRGRAGDPTLAALSHHIGISKSVISEALTGRRLPTERTVAKLVEALGGERAVWISRRRALDPRARSEQPGSEQGLESGSAPGSRAPGRRFSVLQTALIASTAAVIAVAGTSVFWNSRIANREPEPPQNAEGPYLAAENGIDPMRTACKDDAVIAADEARLDNQVHVQLLYSNDCMAVWGRVTRYDGKSSGNSLSMRIYPAADPESDRSQERSADDLQSMYTTMLIEPDVEARVCGIATITIDEETIELGPQLCV